MTTESKALWRAADVMLERGLARRRYLGADGSVCMLGALGLRSGILGRYKRARALQDYVLDEEGTAVVDWNDNVCRDTLEAHAMLCAAAMLAEST